MDPGGAQRSALSSDLVGPFTNYVDIDVEIIWSEGTGLRAVNTLDDRGKIKNNFHFGQFQTLTNVNIIV